MLMDGLVLTWLSSSKPFNSKPTLDECWALWHPMILYEELDFHKVQLEGDVQVVIEEIPLVINQVVTDDLVH